MTQPYADFRPFEHANPRGRFPALLVCDHAVNTVPEELSGLGLDAKELERHIGWDPGARAVTLELAALLDAPALLAGYSRLVIDPKPVATFDTSILENSDGTVIPGNIGLDADARHDRIAACFRPYHDAHRHDARRAGRALCGTSVHPYLYPRPRRRRHRASMARHRFCGAVNKHSLPTGSASDLGRSLASTSATTSRTPKRRIRVHGRSPWGSSGTAEPPDRNPPGSPGRRERTTTVGQPSGGGARGGTGDGLSLGIEPGPAASSAMTPTPVTRLRVATHCHLPMGGAKP